MQKSETPDGVFNSIDHRKASLSHDLGAAVNLFVFRRLNGISAANSGFAVL